MSKWFTRRRHERVTVSVLFAFGTLVGACDTNGISPNTVAWVTTLVDTATPALAAARTFAVPDTIVELDGILAIDHASDPVIAAQVRSQFLSLGWIEKADTVGGNPDVVVVIGVTTRVEEGVSYAGWYGNWGYLPYWGGADPAWAWGAPVGAIPYTYEVGTMVLTMVDLRAPRRTTKQVPVLWVGAMNGILNGGDVLPRVFTGIDQAFEQSPYLQRNP
jgi:hypothetical protein